MTQRQLGFKVGALKMSIHLWADQPLLMHTQHPAAFAVAVKAHLNWKHLHEVAPVYQKELGVLDGSLQGFSAPGVENWQGFREELAGGGKRRQHGQAGQKEQFKLGPVPASEET